MNCENKQNSQVASQNSTNFVSLPGLAGRNWSTHFDEPEMTSDAGLAVIAASGLGGNLLAGIAGAIDDPRKDPDHDMAEMVKQRVHQIIAGYFDANDDRLFSTRLIKPAKTSRERANTTTWILKMSS